MRIIKILTVFGMAILLTSCVPSLHPLFTQKDLVYDPALIGTWVAEDGQEAWIFKESEGKRYEVTYFNEGVPAEFEAHLVRIGSFIFLDLVPEEPNIKNDFYKSHLIRGHTVSRIWVDRDTLYLAMLDYDWLKGMIAQDRIRIDYERVDDRIILTASTANLQKLVLSYAEDRHAFSPSPWYRQK